MKTPWGSLQYKQRDRAPADITALIELVIGDAYAAIIYTWGLGKGEWSRRFELQPLDFGGGEFGISVAMMLDLIPEQEVAKIRGIGRKRAAEIYEKLRKSLADEPGF